jgi:hypothetical protein
MGTVISNLKAKFGVDNSEFKKGLKEGEKATADFKNAAGSVLDQFASMFGIQMQSVSDAVGTANKSLGFMRQSFIAAAKGGDIMSISMKVLKFALISTGIGAIVVLLGSLIAYFSKTGEGTDKYAKILLQLKSVVNNVIDRLAIFGKGLWEIMTGKFKQGWEDMTGAFKGMGTEIVEDWKAAGDLADGLDALEDKEIALINSLEERRAKAAELRLLAKEETEDQKKKLDLLNQAEKLYKSVYGDQIALEQERLMLMKEQLAMQTKDPTDEQRKAVAEQEAKISALFREQAEQLKGLNREKKTALALVTEQLAFEKQRTENLKNTIKQADISNIKMPDFSQVTGALQKMKAPIASIKSTLLDVTSAMNDAFTSLATGFGEFLGTLASGQAGMSDFGTFIGTVFADMAISVGKVAIATGMAVLGIKKALMSLNPYVAIAAGVALVALGYAVKGSLKSAASGGGGGSSASLSSNSFTYDNTKAVKAEPIQIHITGQLVGKGSDLVSIFNYETNRRKAVT